MAIQDTVTHDCYTGPGGYIHDGCVHASSDVLSVVRPFSMWSSKSHTCGSNSYHWPDRHGYQFPCWSQQRHAPQPVHQQQQPCCRQLTRTNASRGSQNDDGRPRQVPDPVPQPEQVQQCAAPPQVPAFMDGINWYCYACLGLLFLTDFTPLGQWLLSGTAGAAGGFPARLAALQLAAFVVPTLLWVKRSGWDFPATLKLQPCSSKQLLTGLAAGPVLWLCINAAVALRTGNAQQFSAALSGALPAAGDGAVSPGMLLLGVGEGGAAGVQQVLALLLFAAVSPAVAEELLFRGLLLTAVQQRLGNTDALAVVAALFALIHLDIQQFFLFCVLGGACGLVTVRSGSVWPAVVLHAAFNATAVAAGLLLHR